MDQRFANRTAIVTGGASGIGQGIARRLAREGATVTIFDRDADAAARCTATLAAEGLKISANMVDITDEDAMRDAIAEVAARSDRLDAVIHCAGVAGPTSTLIADVDIAEFDRVCRVNLRGSFIVVKHSLPHMLRRNYGRVLLFASIAGKEGNAGMCAYSASKAGVIGLVKATGKEYAETGVTINAIAPAVIRTPMVDGVDPAQVKYMTDRIPMKRCGSLDEAAALSAWIVSPEASFNTGFCFDLSGGRAVY